MKNLTLLEAADALGISPLGADQTPSLRESAAEGRLRALGYVSECGRCGGSGRFSYNTFDGDRCYGCGGRGKVLMPLSRKRVAEAVARQAAGELDAYFARNRAAAAARKALRPVIATFDDEWANRGAHASYKKTRRLNAHVVVASAEYLAVDLANSLFDEVHRTVPGESLVERLERANEALAKLRELEAAWDAYEGPNRLTER